MRVNPDRENLFQDAMAGIATLSPREGADILLHYFLGVVSGLDATAALRLREEISSRFGGRYCSQELCAQMTEMLNGHLARECPRVAA
jgi:hypothetical protein